jgi:glucose-6-phosphate-specific signal transduction histidine kinase
MTLIQSRTKVVYFRVSEAEFERYMAFCRSQGVRSISDLARAGLEILVAEEERGYTLSGLTERVTALSGLISGLSGTIQGLTEVVSTKKLGAALEKEL